MNSRDRDRLIVVGRRVLRAQAVIQTCMTEVMSLLTRIDQATPARATIDNLFGSTAEPQTLFNRPLVDVVGTAVVWRGHRCPLGYTRLFDLVERLVRNPGRWIPYDRLRREVWDDDMLSDGAIKVAVTRLKSKLTTHGMQALAEMIRTSGYRCGYFPGGELE